MRKVNIHEAKTTLSQLVEAAESGETVVLARAGKPVVQLVRLKKPKGVRLGVLKGMFPKEFLAAAVEPLSPQEVEQLFDTGIEP
jgi:prevent-host-death family protein